MAAIPPAIQFVDLSAAITAACRAEAPSAIEVLPGEIAGASTHAHVVPAGRHTTLDACLGGSRRVIFWVSGVGIARADGVDTPVLGPGIFIAAEGSMSAVDVEAAPAAAVTFLELRWRVGDEKAAGGGARHALALADARPYAEAIKSAATVSRTLAPTGVVPRFAAGSVEIPAGPDAVGEHAHPMLEQLFLGLPCCDAVVTADGADAPLRGWTLLHIPLGSTHGVRLAAGRSLRYVWIDLFRETRGEEWIAKMHKDI